METQIVLNNLKKTNTSVVTFFIGFKNDLFTNLLVAMVTKCNNMCYFMIFSITCVLCPLRLPCGDLFYDFVAMESTVVLNNFTNLLLLLTPSLLE